MAKNAEAVESWTTSFYRRPASWGAGDDGDDEIRRCQERLEREDAVPYDRDFVKDPVLVGGAAKDVSLGFLRVKTPDATFGITPDSSVDSILRSMESSQYYSENNLNVARGLRWNPSWFNLLKDKHQRLLFKQLLKLCQNQIKISSECWPRSPQGKFQIFVCTRT